MHLGKSVKFNIGLADFRLFGWGLPSAPSVAMEM